MSGSPHRRALQQSELRLRRLLPPEGHEAAAGELQRRAGEPHQGHRGIEPDPEGLHRGPRAGNGRLLHRFQRFRHGEGKGSRRGRIPPHDEDGLRQFPPVRHPGHHETYQSERREGHRLRTDASGRHHFFRISRSERYFRLQGPGPCHHCKSLRRGPRRRCRQGLYTGYFQAGLRLAFNLKVRAAEKAAFFVGNAVANALVNFTYVANGQEEKYSVYTNNEGKASLILNNEDPGEHQVTAAFGGNEKLNPCSAQQKITIKEGTSTANTTANSGVNSTTSTIAYEGGNQTNTTQHQVPLNYDPETGNLYDNNGIIVGGQNDGQSLEYIKNNRPVIDEDGSLV